MRQVENYLSNDVLNTIENISMQMLIASETDPVLHNVISELDLSVIGEKEILKAADADSMQRVQETEQNDFSYEFYRRIERNKRSIFVLGQTEEGVQKVKAELQEAFPKLILAGEYALENCVGNLDAVINEMNATTPDVIVSILPSPLQEHFFAEHKDKMSATIWFGMGELGVHGKKHGRLIHQNDLRLGHQRSAHSQHLLLTAAQCTGHLFLTFLKTWETLVNHCQCLCDFFLIFACIGSHH